MTRPARLVDPRGWTVEPAVVDGVPQFIVRDPHGYLPHSLGTDPGPITTLAALATLVDPATLKEL